MNIKETPVLGAPAIDELWAMISKHPFYPRIELFSTEVEAVDAAKAEISDMHNTEEELHDDSYVSVARVMLKANINTVY